MMKRIDDRSMGKLIWGNYGEIDYGEIRYSEVLKADGSVDMAWCNGEGEACHCSGINCANQTDTFHPAPAADQAQQQGDGTETAGEKTVTYTPSFTYHGFRYVLSGTD